MRVLPADSKELGATLGHLTDSRQLWTEYGLRCVYVFNVIVWRAHSSAHVHITYRATRQLFCHVLTRSHTSPAPQVPSGHLHDVQEAQHPPRQALLARPSVGERELPGPHSPEALLSAKRALPISSSRRVHPTARACADGESIVLSFLHVCEMVWSSRTRLKSAVLIGDSFQTHPLRSLHCFTPTEP